MRNRLWVTVLAVVLVMACATIQTKRYQLPITCAEQDMQPYPTPRNFDGPGSVFRIDKNGDKWPVTVLALPKAEELREVYSDRTETRKWTIGALASYMNVGSADAKAGRELTVTTKLGNGYRYRSYDADVDRLIVEARINYKKNNTYYVVRETTAFRSILYDLSQNSTGDAVFKTDIATLASGIAKSNAGANVTWTHDRIDHFQQVFAEPFNVCFKADRIEPAALGLAGDRMHRRVAVTTPILWSREISGR